METGLRFGAQLVWTPNMDDDASSMASWVVHKHDYGFGSAARQINIDYHTAMLEVFGMRIPVPIIVANRDIRAGEQLVGDFGDTFFMQDKYIKSNAVELAKLTRKRKLELETSFDAHPTVVTHDVEQPPEKRHKSLQTDHESREARLENVLVDTHHDVSRLEGLLHKAESELQRSNNEVSRLNAMVDELMNKSQTAQADRNRAFEVERCLDVARNKIEVLEAQAKDDAVLVEAAKQDLQTSRKAYNMNVKTLMERTADLQNQLAAALEDKKNLMQAQMVAQAQLNLMALQNQVQPVPGLTPIYEP
jgi:hypothetical protein